MGNRLKTLRIALLIAVAIGTSAAPAAAMGQRFGGRSTFSSTPTLGLAPASRLEAPRPYIASDLQFRSIPPYSRAYGLGTNVIWDPYNDSIWGPYGNRYGYHPSLGDSILAGFGADFVGGIDQGLSASDKRLANEALSDCDWTHSCSVIPRTA